MKKKESIYTKFQPFFGPPPTSIMQNDVTVTNKPIVLHMLLANPPYLHTYNYMDCPPDPIQRLTMDSFLGNGWSMSCVGSFPSSSALKVPSDLYCIFFCPNLTFKTMCIVTQKLKTLNGTIWAELHIQALKDFWFAENHILCSKGQLLPQIYKEEEVLKRI